MAEWSIAAVLKTVDLRGSGGSNPSLSAEMNRKMKIFRFFCFVPAVASLLAKGRSKQKKGVLQAHRFISARAPPARREGMPNEMRLNPDAGGNGGAPISPFLQKKRLKLMINKSLKPFFF